MKGFITEYGAIIFGLVVGMMAHFGRILTGDEQLTVRQAAGFLLQLAFIGVLAVVTTNRLGITDGDMRALTAAILAVSAQEVVAWMRRNGWMGFAHSVAPERTIEGERRDAEQKARAAHYIDERGLTDEFLKREAKKRGGDND